MQSSGSCQRIPSSEDEELEAVTLASTILFFVVQPSKGNVIKEYILNAWQYYHIIIARDFFKSFDSIKVTVRDDGD